MQGRAPLLGRVGKGRHDSSRQIQENLTAFVVDGM